MPELIAKQNMRYGTRALKAGDVFTANPRDANLLTRLGRATAAEARGTVEVPPIPAKTAKLAEKVEPQPQNTAETLTDAGQPPIDAGAGVDTGEGETAVSRLRRELEALTGLPVDQRWGTRTLKRKIERARTGHSG